MGRMRKSLVVAALAVAGVIAGTGTDALAADKVNVGKSFAFAFTFIQMEVGVDAGIWAKYGLEPEISQLGGDAKLQQALTAGSIDFGLGSGPGMGFMAKGVPAKAVAAFFGAPVNMSVIVKYDSPIRSVADLKGKKMGVTTAGSLTDWLTRRMGVWQGWGSDGMTIVNVGDLASSRAALRTNQIDALMSSTEVGYMLEDRKEGRNLINAARFVTDFHGMVIFARDDLIKNRPDVVQRFVNGFFATIAFMKANKETTVEVASRTLKTSKEIMGRAYNEEMGMMSDDGRFDPKAVAVLKDSFVEMNILDKKPEDSVLFTTRFVPAKR